MEKLTRHRGVGKVICQLILNLTNARLNGNSFDGIPISEAKVGLGSVRDAGFASENEPVERLVLKQFVEAVGKEAVLL